MQTGCVTVVDPSVVSTLCTLCICANTDNIFVTTFYSVLEQTEVTELQDKDELIRIWESC